ncbi:NPCBM/NEW2 domain-containing protein [Eubacterium limosum]|uniref:NPCBM/NEW2 domain-containing protein n=1 Tax=Eubacterium limosum TaxID=1736 RepID=A0ABT5UPW3_EUBLI|nr:NPCBM/NEW2 domain-containing protein [Eubacterium limosum]MCB6569207.1 NPCBM/NEW2 domain-containing protein [Eubacterium limosum]MDE1470906.1 NPCBM/NEW2 domain-containing protein [Eubacterium limosum]
MKIQMVLNKIKQEKGLEVFNNTKELEKLIDKELPGGSLEKRMAFNAIDAGITSKLQQVIDEKMTPDAGVYTVYAVLKSDFGLSDIAAKTAISYFLPVYGISDSYLNEINDNRSQNKMKKKSKFKPIAVFFVVLLLIGTGTFAAYQLLYVNKDLNANEKDRHTPSATTKKEENNQIFLKDLPGLDGQDYEIQDEIKDSYGNTYFDAIEVTADNGGAATGILNGNYSNLKGSIVISEKTDSKSLMDFAIFADDKPVFVLTDLSKQNEPQSFDIDLSGISELTIKTSANSVIGCKVDIVDAKLTKSEQKNGTEEYVRLIELPQVDVQESKIEERLFKDTYGNLHNNDILLNASGKGYSVYNLNGQYAKFTGQIVCSDDTNSKALMTIRIYLDDELVKEYKNIDKTKEPQIIELDVKDKKIIKFTSLSQDEAILNSICYVVDDKLTK